MCSVMLNEFIDVHEAATHAHFKVVALLNLYVDTLLTELVHALRLSQEQDLHLFPFWVLQSEIIEQEGDIYVSV